MPTAAAVIAARIPSCTAMEGLFDAACWSVSVRAIPCPLEWQDLVQHLLPIGRLLDFRYPATTAIGDARLGDPVVGNGVRRTDIGRAHDTCDGQYPEFRIHAHFLRAPDHEVAVRQYVGDDKIGRASCRERVRTAVADV